MRAEESAEALSLLRAASWCYLRAGFADSVMRCRALLADAYAAQGDELSAIALHCEIAQRLPAEKLARTAKDARGVADRMAARFPAWTAEARFAVLTHVGRHASPLPARALAGEALEAIARGEQREFDNTPDQAAEALAMLAVAVEDPAVLHAVAAKLETLSREQRYAQAKAPAGSDSGSWMTSGASMPPTRWSLASQATIGRTNRTRPGSPNTLTPHGGSSGCAAPHSPAACGHWRRWSMPASRSATSRYARCALPQRSTS